MRGCVISLAAEVGSGDAVRRSPDRQGRTDVGGGAGTPPTARQLGGKCRWSDARSTQVLSFPVPANGVKIGCLAPSVALR
jgi:hypothetical protein